MESVRRRQQPGTRPPRGSARVKKTAQLMATLLLGLPLIVAAEGIQSLDSVRDAIEAYALEELVHDPERDSVSVGRLDPRLRLHHCDAPLQAFRNPGNRRGGRSTVGVRCTGSQPWTIYASVQVESRATALALARSMGRGDRIQAQDLTETEINLAELPHGHYSDAERLIGMQLRRSVRAGEILSPLLVAAPNLVTRGETVMVTAAAGGTQVTMQGEALDSGALGDRIRVRNNRSDRVVEGEIVERGRIRVLM